MIRVLLSIFSLAAGSAAATTTPTDDVAGRIVGEIGGQEVALPLLRSDYDVDIEGDIATVTLTQTFENPYGAAMTAEYLFPLNQKAAVYAMTMEVGDEVVRAKIRKKAEAQAEFDAAEAEGKAAALLTQHRPNMFTQHIANLVPGLPVKVSLSYVQPVPRIDGAYELVVPLIVGPRYEGAPEPFDDDMRVAGPDGWEISPLPLYPAVVELDMPGTIPEERVSLDLSLAAGVPILSLTSATHALAISEDGTEATFANGRVIDNRDLVIRYDLGGETVTAGVLTHSGPRGDFLSILIEPPTQPDAVEATPRELVFVLDTSGSMSGLPIQASKRFMASAIAGLRPDDYFRIIRFSNSASHFSETALRATDANRKAGLAFVRGLDAGGGTEINRAIHTAFDAPQPDSTMRIVVFLSDGYIGGEAEVLHTIRKRIGDARIYAFGIGTSVNRYLLDGMANEGRGYARYVDPTEDTYEVAEQLAVDLKTPLLTDISIDWGDIAVTEMSPARIPDLFAGQQLRILARYDGGAGGIRVNGLVAGRPASLPVTLPTDEERSEVHGAIPLMWARSRIADHERALAVGDGSASRHEEAITELGLGFGLQSRFTSFVAVSERIVNETGTAQRRSVPLPQVAGVPASAYPEFRGSSAPEPQSIFGLLALSALMAARLMRARRQSR